MNDIERTATAGVEAESDRTRRHLNGEFGHVDVEPVSSDIEVPKSILAGIRIVCVVTVVTVEKSTDFDGTESPVTYSALRFRSIGLRDRILSLVFIVSFEAFLGEARPHDAQAQIHS